MVLGPSCLSDLAALGSAVPGGDARCSAVPSGDDFWTVCEANSESRRLLVLLARVVPVVVLVPLVLVALLVLAVLVLAVA